MRCGSPKEVFGGKQRGSHQMPITNPSFQNFMLHSQAQPFLTFTTLIISLLAPVFPLFHHVSENLKSNWEILGGDSSVIDISSTPFLIIRLDRVIRQWGFFHITNHGISKDLCKKLHFCSGQIFDLPSEVKLKAGPLSAVKTYTPHFIASPFFESLRVSGPHFSVSAEISSQTLLNEANCEFSEMLEEYGSRMTHLSKIILEMVIKCLGVDFETKLLAEFKNCRGYFRLNYYSPPECNDNQEVEGLGMHTDMSCITIVYQDDIGGLQVRSKEGQWMDINPHENALVVNIGDLMEAWSNGKFRSSEHRVVLRSNVSRFSTAFFWCFEEDKVIFAPDEVVGEGNSRLYKPFVCADYVRFRENNEKGKFEKVGFTVKHFAGS